MTSILIVEDDITYSMGASIDISLIATLLSQRQV